MKIEFLNLITFRDGRWVTIYPNNHLINQWTIYLKTRNF